MPVAGDKLRILNPSEGDVGRARFSAGQKSFTCPTIRAAFFFDCLSKQRFITDSSSVADFPGHSVEIATRSRPA